MFFYIYKVVEFVFVNFIVVGDFYYVIWVFCYEVGIFIDECLLYVVGMVDIYVEDDGFCILVYLFEVI